MKKFIFLCVLSVLCFVGAFSPLPKALSTVFLTAPDGFAVACQSGYTRISPHLCLANGNGTIYTSGVADNTCRSISWVIPSNARAIYFIQRLQIETNNAIGQRNMRVTYYTSSTCTVGSEQGQIVIGAKEQVAAVNGTDLMNMDSPMVMATVNGTEMWYTAERVDSATHAVAWHILGYYD